MYADQGPKFNILVVLQAGRRIHATQHLLLSIILFWNIFCTIIVQPINWLYQKTQIWIQAYNYNYIFNDCFLNLQLLPSRVRVIIFDYEDESYKICYYEWRSDANPLSQRSFYRKCDLLKTTVNIMLKELCIPKLQQTIYQPTPIISQQKLGFSSKSYAVVGRLVMRTTVEMAGMICFDRCRALPVPYGENILQYGDRRGQLALADGGGSRKKYCKRLSVPSG